MSAARTVGRAGVHAGLLGCVLAGGCPPGTDPLAADAAVHDLAAMPDAGGGEAQRWYAQAVEAFEPGRHAGFGEKDLPGIVLGAPGQGGRGGSLDVVSLGVGGEIILSFGERRLVDGPGPDFIVFENAFAIAGSDAVFSELAEVAVSSDGEHWTAFVCDPGSEDTSDCAGQTPTQPYDADTLIPPDPMQTGGDAFDLADIGVERARFVRIQDRATTGDGNNAGFDLDAVGIVHADDGVAP